MEINSSSKQLATSTSHVAQELLRNAQCSGGSRSLQGDESSEDEEHCGQSSEVDRDRLRGLLKLSS